MKQSRATKTNNAKAAPAIIEEMVLDYSMLATPPCPEPTRRIIGWNWEPLNHTYSLAKKVKAA